jgi:hypothetical protein
MKTHTSPYDEYTQLLSEKYHLEHIMMGITNDQALDLSSYKARLKEITNKLSDSQFHGITEYSHLDTIKCVQWLNDVLQKHLKQKFIKRSKLTASLFNNSSDTNQLEDDFENQKTWVEEVQLTTMCPKLSIFISLFNEYCDQQELHPIVDGKHLRVGFWITDDHEHSVPRAYLIRLSELSPLWKPTPEKEFTDQTINKWLQTASELERVIDKNISGLYESKNLIGKLELNIPVLPTVANGEQSSATLSCKRYRIRWVNPATISEDHVSFYDAEEFDDLTKRSIIQRADEDKITPMRFMPPAL